MGESLGRHGPIATEQKQPRAAKIVLELRPVVPIRSSTPASSRPVYQLLHARSRAPVSAGKYTAKRAFRAKGARPTRLILLFALFGQRLVDEDGA